MNFKATVSKAFSSAKDKMKGAKEKVSSALFGKKMTQEEADETWISNTEIMTPEAAQNVTRGLINPLTIMKSDGYDKVKNDPDVKALIEEAEWFDARLDAYKIPSYYDGMSKADFLEDVGKTNGYVMDNIFNMRMHLKARRMAFTAKKKDKYAGLISTCLLHETRLLEEVDHVNKIQERLMYAIRSGKTDTIPKGKSYKEVLNDTKYIHIFEETADMEKNCIGGGQMNALYSMADEERGTERVLKKGQKNWEWVNDNSNNATNVQSDVYSRIKGISYKEVKSDVDTEKEAEKKQKRTKEKEKADEKVTVRINTANRDVAVSIIDKLFQLDAAVDTSMAKAQTGEKSSLMDKAAGRASEYNLMCFGKESEKDAGFMLQVMKQEDQLIHGQETEDKLKNEGDEKKYENYKNSREKRLKKADKTGVINLDSAKFVEDAYKIAALDIIVGHVDRHGGNFMISEEGAKAIDNDTSFSNKKAAGVTSGYENDKITDVDDIDACGDASAVKTNGIVNQNMSQALLYFDTAFPVVPRLFMEKITGVPSSAVRGALKGLISDDEVEACVGRLEALQEYFNNLPDDKIVDTFEQVDRKEYGKKGKRSVGYRYNYYSQFYTNNFKVSEFGSNMADEVRSKNARFNGMTKELATYIVEKTGYKAANNGGDAVTDMTPIAAELLATMVEKNRKSPIIFEEWLKSDINTLYVDFSEAALRIYSQVTDERNVRACAYILEDYDTLNSKDGCKTKAQNNKDAAKANKSK